MILSARVIIPKEDEKTAVQRNVELVERPQFISGVNAFYLPNIQISTEETETDLPEQDEVKIGEAMTSKKKQLKKFQSQVSKIKQFEALYQNVIIEFNLDREIWTVRNATIVPSPDNGYMIYGDLVMQYRKDKESSSDLDRIGKTLAASADINEDEDEEIPNLVVSPHQEQSGAEKEADLKLVMDQTDTTREQAEQALKRANGDIVNAIMDLSPM